MFVTFSMLQLAFNLGFELLIQLLFSRLWDAVRGSLVTTIDVDRFCGADNADGFGNVLVTGRQTQANIFIWSLLSPMLYKFMSAYASFASDGSEINGRKAFSFSRWVVFILGKNV